MSQDNDNPGKLSAWQAHQQVIEAKARELKWKAPPVKAAIRKFVRERTGTEFGTDLHIGFNLDMSHVGFDIWYESDADLERDQLSGRRDEIARVLREAARVCADAESEVRFHSHQTVREKYGGDYFAYLR